MDREQQFCYNPSHGQFLSNLYLDSILALTTPEAIARQDIDRQLAQCGREVQDMSDMNIMAGLGVAVREFQLTTGSGKHCKHIVDLVSLVRHAIDPDSPLRPIGQTVEEKFTQRLSDQQQKCPKGYNLHQCMYANHELAFRVRSNDGFGDDKEYERQSKWSSSNAA